MKPVTLCLFLFALATPTAAQTQGIPGGAQQGYEQGNCRAGPFGALFGAAIGGVVGGLIGGVNGMLGIEQRRDAERGSHRKAEHRCQPERR